MKHVASMALVLWVAGAAQAQESDLSVSVGVRAWNTHWTTFSYEFNDMGSEVLVQVPAETRLIVVPVLTVRYRNFLGSVSGYGSTDYRLPGGRADSRREFDVNVGYLVTPNVAVTLGYKKLTQQGDFVYEPAGPVLGVSATAPLGNAFSLYGALGVGRLKSDKGVKFDVNYRLSEVGVGYGLVIDGMPRTLTFTVGYRTQAFDSKQALGSQDGRDLTEGLTVGIVATF